MTCVWHDPYICATWLIHRKDTPHSYVYHDSSIFDTWLIHMWGMTHSYVSCVSHDSSTCVTRLIWVCDIFCPSPPERVRVTWLFQTCLPRDSSTRATRLIQTRDTTHSNEWHMNESCHRVMRHPTQVSRLICISLITRINESCHMSGMLCFMRDMWLIHTCSRTHSMRHIRMSDMWCDASSPLRLCVTSLVHTCHWTQSYRQHTATHCNTLQHELTSHVTRPYMSLDSITRATSLIHICHTFDLQLPCGYAWHDSSIRTKGLIWICDRTHFNL